MLENYSFDPKLINWRREEETQAYIDRQSCVLAPRSQSLSIRYDGMWQGLTTSQPSTRFFLASEMLRRKLIDLADKVINYNDEGALDLLNSIYRDELFSTEDECLKLLNLSGNNNMHIIAASCGAEALGTAAVLISGRDEKPVLSTRRSGRLVNLAFTGLDPYQGTGDIMFRQGVQLFSRKIEVANSDPALEKREIIYYETDCGETIGLKDQYASDTNGAEYQLSDETVIRRFQELIDTKEFSLCHIATVDSLGRVIPWRSMLEIINKKNCSLQSEGRPRIKVILNLVQTAGRASKKDLDLEGIDFDAVVLVGHKGLGASMSSGIIIIKDEAVDANGFNLHPSYVRHVLSPQYATTSRHVSNIVNQTYGSNNQPISLPELRGLRLAMTDFMNRGKGANYWERRNYNYELMSKLTVLAEQLLINVPGVKTLRQLNPEIEFMPGIISFIIDGYNTEKLDLLKRRLQERHGIVLSGNVGNIARISIPEHWLYNPDGVACLTSSIEKNLERFTGILKKELTNLDIENQINAESRMHYPIYTAASLSSFAESSHDLEVDKRMGSFVQYLQLISDNIQSTKNHPAHRASYGLPVYHDKDGGHLTFYRITTEQGIHRLQEGGSWHSYSGPLGSGVYANAAVGCEEGLMLIHPYSQMMTATRPERYFNAKTKGKIPVVIFSLPLKERANFKIGLVHELHWGTVRGRIARQMAYEEGITQTLNQAVQTLVQEGGKVYGEIGKFASLDRNSLIKILEESTVRLIDTINRFDDYALSKIYAEYFEAFFAKLGGVTIDKFLEYYKRLDTRRINLADNSFHPDYQVLISILKEMGIKKPREVFLRDFHHVFPIMIRALAIRDDSIPWENSYQSVNLLGLSNASAFVGLSSAEGRKKYKERLDQEYRRIWEETAPDIKIGIMLRSGPRGEWMIPFSKITGFSVAFGEWNMNSGDITEK